MMNELTLTADFIVDRNGSIGNHPTHELKSVSEGSDLRGTMLLPGFVNAHSHAFQLALRGYVEFKSVLEPLDDFFSWREAMYGLALRLSPDEFENIATRTFRELIRNGFVSVCEFHYLHHDINGNPYADPLEMSRRLVKAASRAGIRLCLLQTAYARGGFNKELNSAQKRFAFKSVDAFLTHCRLAQKELIHPLVTHGIAIHSVRACPQTWIEAIADYARRRKLPVHIHVSEQMAEVQECLTEYQMTPIAFLHALGAISEATTLVHATHVTPRDIELIQDAHAAVCLCPSTERNLGDGMCPIVDLHQAGIPLCIGTDQHVRNDVASELREIEEQERLRLRKRCALLKPGQRLAQALMPIGTHGAKPKDFVAVRIPEGLRDEDPEAILDAWLIAGSSRDVTDVWVDGRRVVSSVRGSRP